jgi:hypothetical protein
MGYADMIAALANKAIGGAFMVEQQMVQAIASGAAVRIAPLGQQFYELSGFTKDYYQEDAVVQFGANFARDTPFMSRYVEHLLPRQPRREDHGRLRVRCRTTG